MKTKPPTPQSPTTFSIVLKNFGVQFVIGLLLLGFGAYQFLVVEPVPSALSANGSASGASMFGSPGYAFMAFIGLLLAMLAWYKGLNLSHGSGE